MNVIRKYKGIWQRGERWLWKQIRKMRALIGPTHFVGHIHPWMIRGFSGFQVLVAGNELGLFKLLSDNPNRSVQEIATNLGIPPHSADALMLCCNSMGLVKMNRRNGTYRNTPSIERNYGGPGKGELIEVLHALMYQPFFYTTESLRRGTNEGLQCYPGQGNTLYERLEDNPDTKRIFYKWMDTCTTGVNRIPDRVLSELSDVKNILDVGGGDAVNAIDLVQRLPGPGVTIFDLASTCELAETNINQAGLSERIALKPGNFIDDPFPSGVDAVMFAHIFNIYSDEMNQALIQKSADILPEGGKLVIYNLVSEDDQSGSVHAAFMSLYFQVLATGNGMVYPPKRYEKWFEKAGFKSLAIHVPPRGSEGIFIGTK